MSYVRSGKDSDVYLYGTDFALCLHIAHNRGPTGTVPQPLPGDGAEAWEAFFKDTIPLDHPEAGRHYGFDKYSECITTLEELKAEGLMVPQRVFDRLLREQAKRGDDYGVSPSAWGLP